jgi:hypothetical protein
MAVDWMPLYINDGYALMMIGVQQRPRTIRHNNGGSSLVVRLTGLRRQLLLFLGMHITWILLHSSFPLQLSTLPHVVYS